MIDWTEIAKEPPPKDGTPILLGMAIDAGGDPIEMPTFGAVFCQVASWWANESEAGEWVVYCDLPQDPYLHFEPTHWAHINAPEPPTCSPKTSPST
jgi:hypothetical protein